MPQIRMKADHTDDARASRKAGAVYNVTQEEGWPLVRDGHAEWTYVPEDKVADLFHAEPKKADPAAKRAATVAAKSALPEPAPEK